ncbi:MAG TPA: tetratricopeptide repeat protein [Thermoplasmataceae archaeon]|nr:tetratricopeptide repeat protein [Thermoplasmataceae archaeon]
MEEIEQYLNVGDNFLQKEKYIDALREYQKAYQLLSGKKSEELADLCYRISQAYNGLEPKNDENSRKFAEEALSIHSDLNLREMQVMDLLNLGYIEIDASKLSEAEKYLLRAAELARETRDGFLVATSLNALAELRDTQGRKNDALGIYEEVIKETEKAKDWENYFEALRGKIAIVREKNEEEALNMALKSLDLIDSIAQGIKSKRERKDFKSNLDFMYDLASDIAMELNDVDMAIKIAQRSKSE